MLIKLLWLREGETKVIPETNGEYYLKNNQFILEVYDKEKDNEVFDEAIDRSWNGCKKLSVKCNLV